MTMPRFCLIVEDDPFQCKLLSHQLRQLGVQRVETCPSAEVLLKSIDAGDKVDLIVLDINLPGMDGIEVLRHLVGRRYAGELLLVSGEGESMLATAARLARAHRLKILGQVSKPVSLQMLASFLKLPSPLLEPESRVTQCYTPDEVARAIKEGELVGFYQPKVRVDNRQVVGAEYLVRWQHPEDGLIFPDEFICSAEAAGLICELTATVFADALRQLKKWQERGLDLKVAVNVSMDDLCAPAFADQVFAMCEKSGVKAEDLVLEVTESRLEHNLTNVLEVLGRLRLRHFRLSIDDFGTGHSSLARLRDLPFNELKIDRSFTHRAWEDPRRLAIYESSLDMARRLGMQVVAEGVEDEEDWSFLQENDCHMAQGYYVSRPLPPGEFILWLEGWLVG